MSDPLAQQFIQDFLEEADEHLQRIVGNLLRLEAEKSPSERQGVVSALFRSFHTLKGLSGMVELTPAVDLGHAMESILQRVRRGQLMVTPDLVEALLRGTNQLEAVIATLRERDVEPPDVSSMLRQLASHLESARAVVPEVGRAAPSPIPIPADLAEALRPEDHELVAEAMAEGRRIAAALFTSTPERSASGINVNAAREFLTTRTRLIKAFPIVRGSEVRFGFIVALEGDAELEPFPGLEWTSTPAVAPAESLLFGAMSATVRVDVGRLEEVVRLVGDLVVTRSRMQDALDRLALPSGPLADALEEATGRMQRQLRDMREAVMRVRMVPLAEVFGRMPLAVRDLARASGREVRLVVEGEQTQIDKVLVERLLDPLMHLVRNAIAHGIEPPEQREAAGKPRAGVLTLHGHPEGDSIVIQVSDDGAGIDVDAVAREARLQVAPGPEALLDLISRPGFSTARTADHGSGRGVGMDVVQKALHGMGGTLALSTARGRGATFTLRLPLTLALIDVFLVEVGAERYAVPRGAVDAALEVRATDLIRVGTSEMIKHDGVGLPLLDLGRLFGIPRGEKALGRRGYGLIHTSEGRRTVFLVDRISGLREAVVRSITDPLVARPGLAGATELGDGSVTLILDLPGLVRFARFQKVGVA